MKGKYHLLSGIVFLLLVFLIDLFVGLRFSLFLSEFDVIVLFFVFYLFFMGLLLPDADKFGSWIFKFFLPFAVLSWLLGFLISSLRGKRFRHRGFLHSALGVLLTSIVSSLVVFLFLSFFISLELFALFLLFFSLILGQVFHLLFD